MKLHTLEKLKSSYSEGEKHLIQKTSKEAAMRRLRLIDINEDAPRSRSLPWPN